MLLTIAMWLLIGLIVVLTLLEPLGRVARVLWEIVRPLIDTKPVDIAAKFGKWAVVTGSTDGIGKAYAKELARRGVNLILISRTIEKLKATKDEISLIDPSIEVKLIAADFSRGKEVFPEIEKQLKDINVGILVNNVGKNYAYPMYVGEVPEQDLWDIINLNVGATTLMTRMLIGRMQNNGKGAVVNISSGSEFQPLPLMTVYAATKVYVRSFSEALRAEYSKFGITVQHLVPLFVNTKMNAFSRRLQVSSLFVPDAATYARNAINTLGKLDSGSGYWAHGIQLLFTVIPPVWVRLKVGHLMNRILRDDYFKQKNG